MYVNFIIGMCWFFGFIAILNGIIDLYNGEYQAYITVLVGCTLIVFGYFINKWDVKTKI